MHNRRVALAAGLGWLTAPVLPAWSLPTQRYCASDGKIRLPGGRALSYRQFGDPSGRLVLYLHGTPGSRYEAGLIADEVDAAGVRLVAVDRPGMGCSTNVCGRRVLDFPADASRIATCLGYGDTGFGILAVSGGAPYAAACALCIPQRLTHVAIVSGHTPPAACGVEPGSEDRKIALISGHPRLGRLALGLIARRLDRKPEAVVTMATNSWSTADKKLVLCNPRYYRNLVANLRAATACGPEGAVTDIQLLGRPWGFDLACVPGEKVSLWQGGCDPIATPSMGRYFHRHLRGSELHLDPHAGHVTMLKWHAAEILSRF